MSAPQPPPVTAALRQWALRELAVDPSGQVCLDVGASTGGFAGSKATAVAAGAGEGFEL